MQTQRLCTLVSPAHTELLLDSCVRDMGILPPDAHKVRETWRLPVRLLDVAERAVRDGEVWTAWMNGESAWLFVGHLSLEAARERGQPVLQIDCYDTGQRSKSSLVSTRTPGGGWEPCMQ